MVLQHCAGSSSTECALELLSVVRPVAWVKGCVPGTLSIRALKTCLSMTAALSWEALLTARCFVARDSCAVRGGPWCRTVLPATDIRELTECADAASVAAVRRLADRCSHGSLAKHLAGGPYAAAVKASQERRPCLPVKRSSGRSVRSGKSGVSGHAYRRAKGFVYGDAAYTKNKWGKCPCEARSRHLRDHRSRKRGRNPVARARPLHDASKNRCVCLRFCHRHFRAPRELPHSHVTCRPFLASGLATPGFAAAVFAALPCSSGLAVLEPCSLAALLWNVGSSQRWRRGKDRESERERRKAFAFRHR